MHYNSPNLNGNGGRSTFCGRRFTLLTLWKYFSHSHIDLDMCSKQFASTGKTSIFVRISKSWRSTLWAGHAWRGVLPEERVPSRIWVWSFPSHTSQPGTPPGPWGHTRVGWAPESSGNTRHRLERNRVKQNTQAFVMHNVKFSPICWKNGRSKL